MTRLDPPQARTAVARGLRGDVLTIPGHQGSYFLDNQTPEFRKTATIRAIQFHEPFIVKTMEGDHTGKPGDWLAQGPEGELWVIAQDIFAKTYKAMT